MQRFVSPDMHATPGDRGRQEVPRSQSVHGSSFYAAMRVLPPVQRQAMFAIYAFCRRVDDIADGAGDHPTRLAALETWRADVDALFSGVVRERMADLAEPVRTFGLAREHFHSVIDGVEMDACSDIVAPDAGTLDLYCDRVASAVGRLAVRVFGLHGEDGAGLAHHLGRALQLTNILRDLDEDAAKGRLYLPRELLRDAGIEPTGIAAVLRHRGLPHACTALAQLARTHFRQADEIMVRHPLAVVRAPTLMGKVYETLLERLIARGFSPPRRRVHTGRTAILWSVVRWGLVRWPARSPGAKTVRTT
jgi:phytoene synthase